MSSAGISFGGLASGLDTQAIISALLSVEQRPIQQLEVKKSDLQRQKSLFGNLDGLLDKVNTAAGKLKTSSGFLQMATSSSNEDILTASASASATPGSYSVTVQQLASGQVNRAGGETAGGIIPGETGSVSMQLDVGGNNYLITADASLESIAEQINAEDDQSETGVRAEVIDTGAANPNPSERYQLVLRSEGAGSENSFELTVDDGGAGFQTLVDNLNTNQTDASDAILEVNDVTVYRSTNTVSDIFDGITLDLKNADAGEEVTVTVSPDATETADNINELITAYNELVDFFEAQNQIDEEGQASSPLFGDTTLRSIRSGIRSIVGGSIANTGNENYQLLSQIGITSDTKGRLEFNRGTFEEALADDEQAVTALFTEAEFGIAGQLESRLDLYTDSVDGLLKTRNEGFDRRIRQTSDRIEDAERRLELYETQLTTRYANLETLLARLQGQGSSVNNIGAAFSG
ncbi:MAG: flagellar filament capping protein FliD [Planctomycetota bacterium]